MVTTLAARRSTDVRRDRPTDRPTDRPADRARPVEKSRVSRAHERIRSSRVTPLTRFVFAARSVSFVLEKISSDGRFQPSRAKNLVFIVKFFFIIYL